VFPALLNDLEIEFGTSEIGAVAACFLDAERADFHWAARISERHLGLYESLEDENRELERVAIIGRLGGRWYVATCIIDGDGAVQDLLGLRHFDSVADAERALSDVR
jgi:hypothetical protein